MTIFQFSAPLKNGSEQSLRDFEGQVLLIVNTATKCGLAGQFDELEQLYQQYKEKGFTVLGFPSSQFANQELADNDQIEQACRLNFGVTFPLFAKIDVNGAQAHPLYNYLKKEKRGFLSSAIKWNFTKFLVDRNGKVVARVAPNTSPLKLKQQIEALL